MANSISNHKTGRVVTFSNGVTVPIYGSILMEGSLLATKGWQKRLMVWLAGKNQNLVGSGCVPIEVNKLEWNEKDFEAQKSFLVQIIKAAWVNKTYSQYPLMLGAEYANRYFPEIISLFMEIQQDDVEYSKFDFGFEPPSQNFELCKKHGVYLNYFPCEIKERCLICSMEAERSLSNELPID